MMVPASLQLDPPEHALLLYTLAGLNRPAVGALFGSAPQTASSIRSALLRKFEVENVAELIVRVCELDLVRIGTPPSEPLGAQQGIRQLLKGIKRLQEAGRLDAVTRLALSKAIRNFQAQPDPHYDELKTLNETADLHSFLQIVAAVTRAGLLGWSDIEKVERSLAPSTPTPAKSRSQRPRRTSRPPVTITVQNSPGTITAAITVATAGVSIDKLVEAVMAAIEKAGNTTTTPLKPSRRQKAAKRPARNGDTRPTGESPPVEEPDPFLAEAQAAWQASAADPREVEGPFLSPNALELIKQNFANIVQLAASGQLPITTEQTAWRDEIQLRLRRAEQYLALIATGHSLDSLPGNAAKIKRVIGASQRLLKSPNPQAAAVVAVWLRLIKIELTPPPTSPDNM